MYVYVYVFVLQCVGQCVFECVECVLCEKRLILALESKDDVTADVIL